jgi:hypothetical protein
VVHRLASSWYRTLTYTLNHIASCKSYNLCAQLLGCCVPILSTLLVTALGGHAAHSLAVRPVRLPMGVTITPRLVVLRGGTVMWCA